MSGQVIVWEINKNLKKMIFFFTRFLSGDTFKFQLGNNSRFSHPSLPQTRNIHADIKVAR